MPTHVCGHTNRIGVRTTPKQGGDTNTSKVVHQVHRKIPLKFSNTKIIYLLRSQQSEKNC